jgi:putative transposase
MYEVSKCAPQSALQDLDLAYEHFFRRVKNGENPGFPKFKSKHGIAQSFRIGSKCEVTNTHVVIPNTGAVRLKESSYIPTCKNQKDSLSRQKSITIKRSGGSRWFVSVVVEEEIHDPVKSEAESVGVDLGLKTFAVTSDGDKIEAPNFLRKKEKKLKRLHRSMDRKKKGSKNRKKAVKKLSVAYYRVRCARKDFLHQASSKLVKTKPVLVFEDLNIRGMMANRKLTKSISDAGWGEFIRQCTYKAEMVGGRVVRADRFFASSKTCSRCKHVKEKLDLKERTFHCEKCGLVIDRDLNAAINLKNYVPPDRRESTPALLNEGRKRVLGRKFRKQLTDGASASPESLAGV